MSCEVMYTCDHCNTHCSGEQYASIGRWDESGIIALGKTVHGCSKEHLGIALAKMFGIGINGETDELLNRKRRELTKLADANNFLIIERDNMRARVAELEKRIAKLTAPVTVDGKTPGEVYTDAFRSALDARVAALHGHDKNMGQAKQWRDMSPDRQSASNEAALAVLRAFGQPSQTPQGAVEALRRVRERIGEWDGHTDDAYVNVAVDVVKQAAHEIVDDELARLEAEPATNAEAITLPTKPTKPLRERLEDLASYWEKGATSSSMSEGYRQASKDCAKELREVIDDPR